MVCRDAPGALTAHRDRTRRHADVDAVRYEPLSDERTGLGLFPEQQPLRELDHRDVRSEAGERLSELAADRSTAEHHEPARELPQRPHGLGGEHVIALQPLDGQKQWFGASRDDRRAERQPTPVDLDRPPVDDAAFAGDG